MEGGNLEDCTALLWVSMSTTDTITAQDNFFHVVCSDSKDKEYWNGSYDFYDYFWKSMKITR